jgi:hypothetical protein
MMATVILDIPNASGKLPLDVPIEGGLMIYGECGASGALCGYTNGEACALSDDW